MVFPNMPVWPDVAPKVRYVLAESDASASNEPVFQEKDGSPRSPRTPGGVSQVHAGLILRPCTWVQKKCKHDVVYADRCAAAHHDIEALSLCELEARYRREYNSFRGAKRRSKERHLPMAPELKNFREWLCHVGVHPDPAAPVHAWSVDCIHRSRGYAVGNLRWASREVQNENRRTTKWVLMPDGSRKTPKQFARLLGQPYDTVYKALKGGKWRRRYTAQELLSRYGRDMGLASWKLPDVALEHQYRNDQFKGRSTTRIEWYIQRIMDELDFLLKRASKKEAATTTKIQALSAELETVEAEANELRCAELAKESVLVDIVVERHRLRSLRTPSSGTFPAAAPMGTTEVSSSTAAALPAPSAPPRPARKPSPNNVLALEVLWKKNLGTKERFVKPLTGKQRGQLKNVMSTLGAQTADVLDWCLEHWGKFVYEVGIRKGLNHGPTRPDIGFLSKNYDVAAQLIAQEGQQSFHRAQDKSVTERAPKPFELSVAEPTAKVEPEQLATMEDIRAALALLERSGQSQGTQDTSPTREGA